MFCLPAQVEKGIVAVLLEVLVLLVLLAVRVEFAAHAVGQLLVPLDERLEGLGLATQYVAEVDVYDLATLGDQYVVVVAIAHAQYVRDDHVAGWSATHTHTHTHTNMIVMNESENLNEYIYI